jgi:hypothetical protein
VCQIRSLDAMRAAREVLCLAPVAWVVVCVLSSCSTIVQALILFPSAVQPLGAGDVWLYPASGGPATRPTGFNGTVPPPDASAFTLPNSRTSW